MQKKQLKIAKETIERLDNLEAIPVPFGQPYSLVIGHLLQKLFQAQNFYATMVLKTPEDLQLRNQLQRRILGLQYRLEKVNGGLDKSSKQFSLVNRLLEKTKSWKDTHFIFLNKEITEMEYWKLEELSQYPSLAVLVLEDDAIFNDFMEWAIRDGNKVVPFVEFPSAQLKLMKFALSCRIGRVNQNALKIKKENLGIGYLSKTLTLPFEGKDVSILDEDRSIILKNNYTLTIREIFQMFYDKKFRVGNVEFFVNGIINWNVHHLGPWNPEKKDFERIDLNQPTWWKQLPILEILPLEIAQDRFGSHLNGENWNMAVAASRLNPNLSYEDTHAYLELAIPIGNNCYSVYDFGKFAFVFPATFWEGLATFCQNAYATIAYPDENIFYTHRQRVQKNYEISAEQGHTCMELIRQDIITGREGNLVFQIESENCAKWTYLKLVAILGTEKVPNLFQLPLVYTEPAGVISILFAILRPLPAWIQTLVINLTHLPFGARTKTWIHENGQKVALSLDNHHFWKTTEVYLPALLHKHLQAGALNQGVVIGHHAVGRLSEFDLAVLPHSLFSEQAAVYPIPSHVPQFSVLESVATVNSSSHSYVNLVASLFQNKEEHLVGNSSITLE